MTKFSNKLKKPCFWHILGPFSLFWTKKNFPRKSGSVTHNFTWESSTMPNFKTPGHKDGRKDGKTEGWTDPIL